MGSPRSAEPRNSRRSSLNAFDVYNIVAAFMSAPVIAWMESTPHAYLIVLC